MSSILRIENITKRFPGVTALDDVSLDITTGEVHGLVGENGAGKSTLMHILAGVCTPDSGRITLEGRAVQIDNERRAQELGIGMVFQERSLVNGLSVAENIFAGRLPSGPLGMVNRKLMRRRAGELLLQAGLSIDPARLVGSLSAIEKQLVEIAKALSLNAKVLILDEPTATITERETQVLFSLIRELRSRGISVIYISHRLQELSSICDRVSVLKDGQFQGTRAMTEVSLDELVSMMVGRAVTNVYDDRGWKPEHVVLEVRGLTSTAFRNVSFRLYQGEILGIAGLAGAGRTEVALALFGCDPQARGQIIVRGRSLKAASPARAIAAGIGYLTEDRKEAGLFLGLDIPANIASASIQRFAPHGFMRDSRMDEECVGYVDNLRIRTPSLRQRALNLSGGNQQKLMLARWLLNRPGILIVDEPTRGIDVGAKEEIFNLLRQIAGTGTSIIVISSELHEIIALCDRVMVMWQGRKSGELSHREATEEKMMKLSAGLGFQERDS
jgi:ribose transport system ATP-binding protein